MKVSCGFPRGVRNLYITHNWDASHAAHKRRTKLDANAKLPNTETALSSSGARCEGCNGQQLQNMSCSQSLSLQQRVNMRIVFSWDMMPTFHMNEMSTLSGLKIKAELGKNVHSVLLSIGWHRFFTYAAPLPTSIPLIHAWITQPWMLLWDVSYQNTVSQPKRQ